MEAPMPTVLTDSERDAALARLQGWTGDADGLHRTVELTDFPTAISVVDRVAEVAEQRDHHPDIDIRWRTLTFGCATHSAGGVTELDVQLAEKINEIVTAAG
jgi:4a-hydroxytetrahydrobiopterin dehydratase